MGASKPARRTSERGLQRRQLLLDAATELVQEKGFTALSHRSVAQRAGVPLSATTYYFADLDHLVHEAVQGLAAGWLASAREVLRRLPRTLVGSEQITETILRVVAFGPVDGRAVDPRSVLSMYERYLESGRHPHLRPVIDEYDDHLDTLLVEVLGRAGLPASRSTARLVLAVVDGALLRALAEGLPVSSARAPLERLLPMLAAEPAESHVTAETSRS